MDCLWNALFIAAKHRQEIDNFDRSLWFPWPLQFSARKLHSENNDYKSSHQDVEFCDTDENYRDIAIERNYQPKKLAHFVLYALTSSNIERSDNDCITLYT